MNLTITKTASLGLMLLVLGGVEARLGAEASSAPAGKTFGAPYGLKV